MKNGTRSSGSDRAPLAIIEFVGNAKDVIYHSGNQSTSILEKQLKEIESKKYIKHVVKLVHPETGAAVEVTKLIERQDLSGKVKQLLTRQEISIVKKLEKFSRSKKMFKHARQADEQAEKTIPSIQDGQQGRVLPPKGRTREILASGSYKIRHAAIKPAGPSNFAAASSASQAQAGESSKDAKAKDAKPISSKAASSLFGGSFWKRFGL